jgi:hypothetical protein
MNKLKSEKRIKMLLEVEWTTKEKKKIKLGDMSIEHLLNTRNMLKRKGEELHHSGSIAYCYSGGEMAEYFAHQEGEFTLDRAMRLLNFAVIVDEVLQYKIKGAINDYSSVTKHSLTNRR